MVQDSAACCINEGAKIPIDVIGEHDGRGFIKWDGDNARCPGWTGGNGVCGIGDYIAREAFEGTVEEREGYGGGVGRDDGPIALVIADLAAVESVVAHIVVFRDMGGYALDGKGAVFDTVGITADDRAEEGVYCLVVADVVGGIVVSEDDVLRGTTLVVDVEIGQTRTVWDKGRIDARY